jgi:hypothetical protein
MTNWQPIETRTKKGKGFGMVSYGAVPRESSIWKSSIFHKRYCRR